MEREREILTRYFLGESDENEKKMIHQWIEESTENKKTFINERIRFDASLFIDEDELPQKYATKINLIKPITLKILKVASVILLVLLSGYLTNTFNTYKTKSNVILQNIYVPVANRTKLVLPDGTQVWLNSNTTLRYPNLFLDKNRVVEVDGEAYFEVVKNNNKPFIVKTSKYNIEVLGTTFNVEAYEKSPEFKAELYTGAIKIYKEKAEDNTIYLRPKEYVKLVNGELRIYKTIEESNSWKNGLITIENSSFEGVMGLFEKYFGEQIIIKNNNVKNLGYRGKFRISDGIDHALRVLQNDFKFKYERDKTNNIIYIY